MVEITKLKAAALVQKYEKKLNCVIGRGKAHSARLVRDGKKSEKVLFAGPRRVARPAGCSPPHKAQQRAATRLLNEFLRTFMSKVVLCPLPS